MYEAELDGLTPGLDNDERPFRDAMNWAIACWVKKYQIGSNALDALLKIEGVRTEHLINGALN